MDEYIQYYINLSPMKSKPLISIIIPVFNIEKYLPACIKSIQAQTFTNYECILIDDGSTDRSKNICDEICSKDYRFSCIHKKNQGISQARNTGFSHSVGDYIIFIDGDDYIHPQMLEILIKTSLQNNFSFVMVYANIITEYNNNFHYINTDKIDFEIINQKQLIQRFFGNYIEEKHYVSVWNKLYPRKLIENIKYRQTAAEDGDYNIRIFLKSQNAAVINLPLYYYLQRPGSLSKLHKNKNFIKFIDSYFEFYQLIPKENEIYKSFCLYKLYKRLLNVRYHTLGGVNNDFLLETIQKVKRETWKDLIYNKEISIFKKTIIILFYYIPSLYSLFIFINNKKAKY